MRFATHCPNGQMCGTSNTTGCLEGQCQLTNHALQIVCGVASMERGEWAAEREELVGALRYLLAAAETRPVLSGDGVKAVREAGKFMKAIDTARAVLVKYVKEGRQ